jgi:hypothetical protein
MSWDLILWQRARRELAVPLLGVPVDQVTRRDLLWAVVGAAAATGPITGAACAAAVQG